MSAISLPKLPALASSPIAVEVLNGLTEHPKKLSPWLFYDEAGSRLFEEITELPEYYVTRTERAILAEHADQIVSAAAGGRDLSIIELGAGTATKTGLLLNAAVRLQGSVTYYPIDVSETALEEARTRLEAELPEVTVEPIVADYTEGHATEWCRARRKAAGAVYRLEHWEFCAADAVEVLRGVRAQLSPGDCLLLGTDMVKDTKILLAAYDDAAGVTARFNMNVLVRINRELDADFNPQMFRHQARWNEQHSRIEMHLESLLAQRVAIRGLDMQVRFSLGETIHTENSYKFTDARVGELLTRAGFRLRAAMERREEVVYGLSGGCQLGEKLQPSAPLGMTKGSVALPLKSVARIPGLKSETPEFPVRSAGRDRVCAFLYGKAHRVRGTH